MTARNAKVDAPTEPSAQEFVITRVFEAPRELVWKAHSEVEHLKHWWGPKGFTLEVCKLDFRPGGIFHYSMRSPEGFVMWGKFIYREIVAPERIVSILSFSDEKGGVTRHPISETWPLQTLNTMTLSEHGGRTTLTIRSVPHAATEAERQTFAAGHDSMRQGFAGTLNQLADHLAAVKTATERDDREFVFTRVFDAPRSLVFKAWTDSRRLAQWWGPSGFTNPVCALDVRPGGAIRIDMRGPDGTVYPMTGVYREIVEPERLVFTSAALDDKGNPLFEVLNTVTFAEHGGKTTQMVRARIVTTTAGAAQYLEGMEEGWTQSLERLDAHVAKA
jgi:uncharacterized protein YndB with AHSA1/START domain